MPTDHDTLCVRRLKVEDLPTLIDFYQSYFPDKKVLLDKQYWHWQLEQNPLINDKIPFFILEQSKKIYGGIGYIPLEVKIGTEIKTVAHPTNFFVAPDYKGLPALRLIRAVLKEKDVVLASNMSQDAKELLKSMRFKAINSNLNEYYYGLAVIHDRTKQQPYLSNAYHFIKSQLRIAYVTISRRLNRIFNQQKTCIKTSETLDTDFIAAINQRYQEIELVKTEKYLNWRYTQSPYSNIMFFYSSIEDKADATCIVHFDKKRRQAIMDVIYSSQQSKTLYPLLLEVLFYCIKNNIQLVTTTFSNIDLNKLFRKIGFKHESSNVGLMVYNNEKTLRNKLTQANDWHFIIGDTDLIK